MEHKKVLVVINIRQVITYFTEVRRVKNRGAVVGRVLEFRVALSDTVIQDGVGHHSKKDAVVKERTKTGRDRWTRLEG